jgi:hypothetical protein
VYAKETVTPEPFPPITLEDTSIIREEVKVAKPRVQPKRRSVRKRN